MCNAIAIVIIIALAIGWYIERIKFKALIYYLVSKEYTEPTKEEMERCIDIAIKKMIDEIFKK